MCKNNNYFSFYQNQQGVSVKKNARTQSGFGHFDMLMSAATVFSRSTWRR